MASYRNPDLMTDDTPLIPERNQVLPFRKRASSFEELEAYQRAYAVSLIVHREASQFPPSEMHGLTQKIKTSSKQVCTLIAEGFVRQGLSPYEFGRYLSLAMGSCGEMLVWISYCHDLGYIPTGLRNSWRKEYQSITKMLQTMRDYLPHHS